MAVYPLHDRCASNSPREIWKDEVSHFTEPDITDG